MFTKKKKKKKNVQLCSTSYPKFSRQIIGCHTSKTSKFFDHYLQPHAKALPSYIDTSDFINNVCETENITKDTFLVTLVVKSFYAMGKDKGMEAAKLILNFVNERPIATKTIIRLILINSIFKGFPYLQKMESAIGTICTPNIRAYMYPYVQPFLNCYCRLIDDLFLLWNGSERKLLDFLAKLVSTCHPTIKFDYKYSQNRIDF